MEGSVKLKIQTKVSHQKLHSLSRFNSISRGLLPANPVANSYLEAQMASLPSFPANIDPLELYKRRNVAQSLC